MTEPSQYFKGRTVQEQMNEVIGYVDTRAAEVAAAKADDVLQPAEDAKDAAIAAQEAAEDARDTTLAALPQIQQDIADLKAEDVSIDGRLDTVELKVTTAEGNIVTIQGRVTAVETKNSQQDSAITALQTADAQNVKINDINQYAVGLTGNQRASGNKTWVGNNAFSLEGEAWRASLIFPSAKRSDTSTEFSGWFRFMAGDPSDSGEIGRLEYDMMANGHRRIRIFVVSPSGQYVAKTLLEIDENGGVVG